MSVFFFFKKEGNLQMDPPLHSGILHSMSGIPVDRESMFISFVCIVNKVNCNVRNQTLSVSCNSLNSWCIGSRRGSTFRKKFVVQDGMAYQIRGRINPLYAVRMYNKINVGYPTRSESNIRVYGKLKFTTEVSC